MNSSLIFALLVCGTTLLADPSVNKSSSIAGKLAPQGTDFDFQGFAGKNFAIDGVACKIVAPTTPAPGNPWIWRARFWGHQPQLDKALLEKGFHVAYCEVGALFGAPPAVARWNAFYSKATEAGLSPKPVLEGMSRGGLIIYNWAKANPDKVSAIYGDNPVCAIRSWPGGKGKGKGSPGDWATCLKVYNLTDEQSESFNGNPFDGLESLAKANVPLIHVVGSADSVVPVAENTDILEARYKALGGKITVIRKPGLDHHPHSLPDPTPLVDFILSATK